jgi:hypothetical protein
MVHLIDPEEAVPSMIILSPHVDCHLFLMNKGKRGRDSKVN